MKLRQLELTNVRRFGGQKAQLGPFGDGLTTITAENEAGKSTFFDALHALFFVPHGSSSQEVKSLQPYSGGAASVAAVVEIDGTEFRVEKSFLVQKSAKIIDCSSGQVIKQQGDAEAWIEENINKVNKGPAGLLWVRQGATHVDPEGKDKDASNVAARRDLMSSVRGQIDAVTGGRRMDKIVEQCRKELDALATKGLKAKAGSPWKAIEDKVDELLGRKERLEADVKVLSQALAVKRQAKSRLQALHDPQKQEARVHQLASAEEAYQKAQQHDRSVTDADKALQLIVAEKNQLIRQIKDITDTQERRQKLVDEITLKEAQTSDLRAVQRKSDSALADAKAVIAQKEAERRDLVQSLSAARAAEKSLQKWERLRVLADLTLQLSVPQKKLWDADVILERTEITQTDLDHLVDLERRISIAHEQRRAQFAKFSVEPSKSGTAECDGFALEHKKETLIDRPLTLKLSGFGAINLSPAVGAGAGIEDPDALEAEHAAALQTFGVPSVQDARNAFNAGQGAANDKTVALAEIRGLAPDGVEALDEEWQALCKELGHSQDDPLPDSASPQPEDLSAEQIEAQIIGLDDDLEDLRSNIQALQTAVTQAANDVAEATGVLNHLLVEKKFLAKPQGEDAALVSLQTSRDDEAAKEEKAAQTLADLKLNAPDLNVARSTHERLISADKADRDEVNKLERELARVDGAIETQSEGAVEEKLAEVSDQLEKAVERAKRYELQAKALNMLIAHLDEARKDAQETYFEPIRNELRPLLAQLHAGADFELDPDKMLVGKIIRNGVEDDINVLSGGAYEQIAILTRLAFAKLFAKQGRQVPLILDDALVHTDDERISTMFDMLSHAAKDQQIIVLSCRTRAFSDLGGTRAFIETKAI
ncbi:MAG: AAA family ATPase [Pelagimonas sp.]|uniref:AAA family ATPase n=1 Tax=Pelagimonas sp. TaxID=2073170 RepID=UPI003D6BE0C2|nr:AAA family ATPase [Roseovarius sp.]